MDYATNQNDKIVRTFLLETYKFRVRRSRGEKKTSITRSKLALTRMIQVHFRRKDKLKKLRHIIKDAPPSRVRAELRRIERSLCEICDLGAVIDIVKVGKKNARTALQKALDRKDSDRNDVVRMLIRAGASSKYLTDPIHIREANQIARVVLMNSIPSAAPSKQKKKKDMPSLHPIQAVFGCVLSQLSRTALASAKHGPTRKKSSTLVVPDVVYQCATFLREHGLRTQGVFRIPGDMGIVKRLKNLYVVGVRARSARISLLFQLLRVLTRITYTTHDSPHSQEYDSNSILEYQHSNTNARTQVQHTEHGMFEDRTRR